MVFFVPNLPPSSRLLRRGGMDNSLPGIFCAPSGFFFYSPTLETLVLSGFAFLGNQVHCQIFKATGLGLTWPQRHPDTMGQAFQGHEGTCTHVRFQLALVIIALVFSPLANQANAFFFVGTCIPSLVSGVWTPFPLSGDSHRPLQTSEHQGFHVPYFFDGLVYPQGGLHLQGLLPSNPDVPISGDSPQGLSSSPGLALRIPLG